MGISRKEFIKKTALVSGGIILLPVINNMAGCSAGAEILVATASHEGVIKFNVSGMFKNPGEGKLLEVDNTGLRIMLIKKDANSFTALDPVCTHKGCELIKRKNFLECPCHGSEFDLAGKVLKGPADIPLGGYRTDFDGKNTVTIFLK